MDTKDICLQLVRTDDEDEVLDILSRHDLVASALWRPLGDIENNLSIAGNQQSNPTAALVEKLINSIDSLMILKCLQSGIAPDSPDAPASMIEATTKFFGIPEGNIAKLSAKDRGRLAENVQLVATGDKSEPSLAIVDFGEGQRPIDFPTTFCSLVRSNKLRIPFVQGKYNMGGCGVLPFCGRQNLQLIVSRRHPDLVDARDDTAHVGWGWTVIRRRDPDEGRRSSYYEYLAPDGQVPSFHAESLPILPGKESAYEHDLLSGSYVKLFNYHAEFPSSIVFDLNFELSRRLYRLAIPIRLYERRDYRGHSKGTILTGMSVRLEDDRSGVIEDGFPDSGVMSVDDVGDVPVQVTVFKKSKARNYISPQSSILFTVNGQVHGGLGRRFCSRESVRLDYLKNDLMAVVDCTNTPARVREDLFMPSRDRLRSCVEKQAFEAALESYLQDHEDLHRLNRIRRDEELSGRLADDKPLSEALKNVIDSSPELRTLFRLGVRIPSDDAPGDREAAFEGRKFPTYFRPKQREDHVTEVMEIGCTPGGNARASLLTDAENEYFTRVDQPGSIAIEPAEFFKRVNLHDGRATLVLVCPQSIDVGAVIDVTVEVTDPSRDSPFKNVLQMCVREPEEHDSDNDTKDKPSAGALALPKVVEVTKDMWADLEFGPESGLTIHNDVDGGLVAKVNVDNEYLRRTLDKTAERNHSLVRKQFVYGLVLSGLALWKKFSDHEDSEELLRSASSAIAMVLLPSINVLGSLARDEK